MFRISSVVPYFVAVAVLVAAGPSAAQQGTLGSFGAWKAFAEGSGKDRICYIGAEPEKEEGKYTRRGETYVLVSHRPAEKIVGEVSVEAGYSYRGGSEVELSVDGKAYRLFTRGSNAWAYDSGADAALVRAMKAGRQMIIKGTSSRGTLTTDTYSLTGFTAAFEAARKACRR